MGDSKHVARRAREGGQPNREIFWPPNLNHSAWCGVAPVLNFYFAAQFGLHKFLDVIAWIEAQGLGNLLCNLADQLLSPVGRNWLTELLVLGWVHGEQGACAEVAAKGTATESYTV